MVEPNVGQRFHMVFHIGSAYYLREYIQDFFTQVWGRGNMLLHSVHHDLSLPMMTDGLRAVGLIGKYITGPWFKYATVQRPV